MFQSNVCTFCMPANLSSHLNNSYYNNLVSLQGAWVKLATFDLDLKNIYFKWLAVDTVEEPSVIINQNLKGDNYSIMQIYGNYAFAIKGN